MRKGIGLKWKHMAVFIFVVSVSTRPITMFLIPSQVVSGTTTTRLILLTATMFAFGVIQQAVKFSPVVIVVVRSLIVHSVLSSQPFVDGSAQLLFLRGIAAATCFDCVCTANVVATQSQFLVEN